MNYIITSTPKYRYLAHELITRLEYGDIFQNQNVSAKTISNENPDIYKQLIKDNFADYEEHTFPDKETYERYTDFEAMTNKRVILIGGTIDKSEYVDLLFMASTIAEVALSLTIVIPFMGYSTMERRTKPGEIVKAAKSMHFLKKIPNAEIKNTFVFFDLHTEGLPNYLGEDVRKFHIYTKQLVFDACAEISNGDNFILGSVDTGRSKWIESLAKDMSIQFNQKIEAAIVSKERKSGTETSITGYQGADPKGKTVIIYDDMIRTGGSVIKAANLYRELGATSVHMITTHGVFPDVLINGDLKPSVEQFFNTESNILDSLYVTDTHPNVFKFEHKNYHVKSVAGLIAKTIKKNTEFI